MLGAHLLKCYLALMLQLTWAGLGHLVGLARLRHLNCSGIKYCGQGSCTDSTALHRVLSRLSSLTMGDACTLSWVDDQLMGVVGQHALQLTDLDCGGCIDMTDQGACRCEGNSHEQS